MSDASHYVPRPPVPVNRALALPEIAQAFIRHAPVLQERLNRTLPIAPKVTRTWRNGPAGRPIVDLTIHCDEQADQFFQDQKRATIVAKELLIQLGFVVLVTATCKLQLLSYYGTPVAAPQVAA